MADLAKWDVQGSVASLMTEPAEWDPGSEYWKPARHFTVAAFRRDGAIGSTDSYNWDGSVAHSRWFYDQSGRLTESHSWMNDAPPHRSLYRYDAAGRPVRTLTVSPEFAETDLETSSYDADGRRTKVAALAFRAGNVSYSIEGTDMGLGAPGAVRVLTTYDHNNLPVQLVFEDETQNQVRQVIMTRDSAGRLVKVAIQMGGHPLSMCGPSDQPMAAEASEALQWMMGSLGGIFSETNFIYDAQGRLIERTHSMLNLGLDRTIYRYGDGDDSMEETQEHHHREASFAEDGTVTYSPDNVTTQQNRFAYRYDDHGNWVERTVFIRPEAQAGFQASNITRRTITYYPS